MGIASFFSNLVGARTRADRERQPHNGEKVEHTIGDTRRFAQVVFQRLPTTAKLARHLLGERVLRTKRSHQNQVTKSHVTSSKLISYVSVISCIDSDETDFDDTMVHLRTVGSCSPFVCCERWRIYAGC